MTLFEAIRALKEGQIIEGIIPIRTSYASSDGERGSSFYNPCHVEWKHGKDKPTLIDSTMDLNAIVRIVDLPKPKMTLEEGLARLLRNELVQVTTTDNGVPLFALLHGKDSNACSLKYLRSLPIDWQAEADRKEGK